jgi:hypothetical protein
MNAILFIMYSKKICNSKFPVGAVLQYSLTVYELSRRCIGSMYCSYTRRLGWRNRSEESVGVGFGFRPLRAGWIRERPDSCRSGNIWRA